MDKKKPIRRHSGLRYFGKWAGYYLLRGFSAYCRSTPFLGAILFIGFTVGVLTILRFTFLVDHVHYFGSYETAWKVRIGFIALISALVYLDYNLIKVARDMVKNPYERFPKITPPAVNEVLPEAEVLVRASMPANSATLLRAASGKQMDDAPAVLLRAANSETAE